MNHVIASEAFSSLREAVAKRNNEVIRVSVIARSRSEAKATKQSRTVLLDVVQ